MLLKISIAKDFHCVGRRGGGSQVVREIAECYCPQSNPAPLDPRARLLCLLWSSLVSL